MYRTQNLRVNVDKYRKESYLYGDCEDDRGCVHHSSLRLDDWIGDRNGRFQWGGHDFTKDADEVTFNPSEGASRVPVLRADFHGIQGDINLAERINNENGELRFHCHEIDKSEVPDYPEDVPTRGSAFKADPKVTRTGLYENLSVHHQNLGWVDRHLSGTVNVVRGSWEWGREVGTFSLTIKLRNIYSGHRGSKNDNNNFNLYDRRGQIAFHISFRRHDQTIRFNSYSRGTGWGPEGWINFSQQLKDEKPIDMLIQRRGEGSSWIVDIGDGPYLVDVYPCDLPNSLTYRSSNNNDSMFGQNVGAEIEFWEEE
ncbi:Cyanovirin-N [Talaromyces pinophilus]|nr:Cyanovirin-N [Talaromyces pinophilus]